jgi:hypothetical protein
VQSVFPIVVFGAVAFSVVMSIAFLLSRTSAYDEIGKGGFAPPEREAGGAWHLPAPNSPAGRAERELEIRQMVSAHSERLRRRGEPELDVDAEVERLLADEPPPPHEAGLLEEVRQLVLARNERRARQGLEQLDVDSEVARTLAELEP